MFNIEQYLTMTDLKNSKDRLGNELNRLRQKEQLFDEIVGSIPGAVYQFKRSKNGQFSIPYMSDAIDIILGLKSKIFTEDANKIFDYIHPDDQKGFLESIEQSASSMSMWEFEFRVINTDNKTLWIKSSSNPILPKNGDILWNGVMMDVTEKKHAEEKLKESQERFKKLSNLTFEGIIIHNQGLAIDANESLTRLLAYTKEELVGKNVIDLCVLQEFHSIVKENIVKKYAKPYEAIIRKKDGTLIPVEFESRNVKYKNEELRVTAVRDITERKMAEASLKKSERDYQEIFNAVVEGIGYVDENEFIRFCNPAFADIFEAESADQLIGKNLFEFISIEKFEFIKSQTALRKKGSNNRYELEIKTMKGNNKTLSISVSPRYDEDGNFIGTIGAIIDITETKRLQKLETRAERLETAGTIAGQVAHDFNNLLAPLIAYPEFIKDELPKNHPSLTYIDQMEKAAEKIASINQDLLAMGRRGHYNQEKLNINTIIRQAAAELNPIPKTLAIELDLCEDLMDINGGSAQIHRVINNLFHNAKDAMQNIGVIKIKTENYYEDDVSFVYGRIPKGEYVKLTVSDTGCGIPDDIIQKIFDPFFSSKTTDKKRGSGLGMSVVDAVIKDHNGYIDLTTKVGEGTSFFIYFPITRKSKDNLKDFDIYGGNETILIIDDDEVQRYVSGQILTKLGYQITTVESGEKGVELLKKNQYDLIILDMIMPNGMDGAETYYKINEIYPDQKAIIVSGFAESDRVLEAQKMGVGVFVQKPLKKEAIAAAVRNELNMKKEIPVS